MLAGHLVGIADVRLHGLDKIRQLFAGPAHLVLEQEQVLDVLLQAAHSLQAQRRQRQ